VDASQVEELIAKLRTFDPPQCVVEIDPETRHDVLQVGPAIRIGDVGIYHARDRDEAGRPVDTWNVCHIYMNGENEEWGVVECRVGPETSQIWSFPRPRSAIIAAISQYVINRFVEHLEGEK
jgi:hypothetical protein